MKLILSKDKLLCPEKNKGAEILEKEAKWDAFEKRNEREGKRRGWERRNFSEVGDDIATVSYIGHKT